jgi:uncharacterized protein YciU (UPF0263 family)
MKRLIHDAWSIIAKNRTDNVPEPQDTLAFLLMIRDAGGILPAESLSEHQRELAVDAVRDGFLEVQIGGWGIGTVYRLVQQPHQEQSWPVKTIA